MSTIKVDKITGRTGSAGASSPLQFNGDTLTATLTTPTIDSIKLTPGSAPGSPVEGQMYYDSTSNLVKIYNGNAWENLTNTYQPKASGGQISAYSSGGVNYMVHSFITSGTFTPASPVTVDCLVVAGGGGSGSSSYTGGGGAGGVRIATAISLTAGTYAIVRGGGGAVGGLGGNSSMTAGTGSMTTITATGGGYGGRYQDGAGTAGGSGGGAGSNTGDPQGGAGITDSGTFGTVTFQGYRGGHYTSGGNGYQSAGGGGAGEVGESESGAGGNGGDGGDGIQNLYRTGVNQWYAGGGAGSHYGAGTSGGAGGSGGGGAGGGLNNTGNVYTSATNGTANTGGGGGGGHNVAQGLGTGGSGIVIIRYAI